MRPDAFSRVGATAAHTLEALCVAVCGEPRPAVRAWRDGDTLLLILQPGEHDLEGLDRDALPELVAEAVRVRTGCELADGRRHRDRELGAELFLFRLPSPAVARAPARATGATAWRRWSPTPPSGVLRRG